MNTNSPALVSAASRAFIIAAAILVTTAGVSLYFLSEHTHLYFAWTIRSPLTAAHLGAGYLTVAAALVLALREREWARVRVGVWVVATGLISILFASLLHLDKFHLHSQMISARGWAWSWMFLYVVLVPALIVVVLLQRRATGTDPPVRAPLPGTFRLGLRALSVVMLGIGIALFAAPATAETFWPWPLTPLTARMVASFYIAIAVSLLVAAHENDYTRIHVAAFAWVLGVVLQMINTLLRYPLDSWFTTGGVQFVLVMTGLLLCGGFGIRGHWSARA